jgi:DNA-binding helix-hairpin-helix protein with protein kinase domain
MFAVIQMFCAREDARFFWQESYQICVDKLIEARIIEQRLRRQVRRHRRAAVYAIADCDAAQAEMQAAHAQRMQAIQQRDEAYHLAEYREEARTQTMVLAGRLENDFHRREVEYLH